MKCMHVTRRHEVGCGVRMQPSLASLREDAREATSALHTIRLLAVWWICGQSRAHTVIIKKLVG